MFVFAQSVFIAALAFADHPIYCLIIRIQSTTGIINSQLGHGCRTMGGAMANRDPERKAATRRRIMDACWDVYAADPTNAVSVTAIVKAAGVHRSTFYEYFDDARSVLAAIEDELAEAFGAEAARAFASEGADPAGIVQRVYVAHGDRLSLLLGESGDPGFARRLKDALRPVADHGLGLGGKAFDPYWFEFAASGILAAATLWYERGCDLEPAKFGEGIRKLLFSIASTRLE